MMDLHEWLTSTNTTRTHQGAEGPPRERRLLLLFTLRPLFARCERALCTSLSHKKENCGSRPRPNPSKTSTRPTSSEEVTSILASIISINNQGSKYHNSITSARTRSEKSLSIGCDTYTSFYRRKTEIVRIQNTRAAMTTTAPRALTAL